MRRSFLVLFIVMLIIFSLSCSNKKIEEEIETEVDEKPVIEATSEVVFTYKDKENSIESVPEIFLMISGEPIKIPGHGFVKYKGCVISNSRIALIENSGIGQIIGIGGKIGDYQVEWICSDYVRVGRKNLNRVGKVVSTLPEE